LPELYIIAGCNGAGKTTASYTVLPEIFNCREFVNADEIAKGLSPFQPERVAIQAGRIMLHRIEQLIAEKESFAFETTLSTVSYRHTIKKAQDAGYNVTLIFFWLNDVNLALHRVKGRVAEGGHNIPEDIIRRRYRTGLKNLIHIFIKIANKWIVVDNSKQKFSLIAEGDQGNEALFYDNEKWNLINIIANED
jgi:predicted ABC-type ATPase